MAKKSKGISEEDKKRIMSEMKRIEALGVGSIPEGKEIKEIDYTNQVEYVNNYLSEKALILNSVADKLTDKWKEFNADNKFVVKTKVIYFNNTYRVSVLIESITRGHNIIFYSRQDRISVELFPDKQQLKETVQDFILSVMGDLMERGVESLRREQIIARREGMYQSVDREVPGSELILYPMTKEESFVKEKSQDEPSSN